MGAIRRGLDEEARPRKGATEQSPESSRRSQWSPKEMMDWLKVQTEKSKFISGKLS